MDYNQESNYILANPEVKVRVAQLGVDIELPTLPSVYINLQNVFEDEKSNINAVSAVIENDQVLSTKILKIVNSAAYGLPNQVTSISRAVSLLGFNEVQNIALSTSIVKTLNFGSEKSSFDLNKLWEHSVGVAVAARILANYSENITLKFKEEAFVAGLVHDVGKIIELKYFQEEFLQAVEISNNSTKSLTDAENEILGFSHQDMGAYLMDSWNMQRDIVKAIELHGTPEDLVVDDESYTFVAIIHLAGVLVHFLEIGNSGNTNLPEISEECWLNLNIPQQNLPKILTEIKKAYFDVHKVIAS